MHKIVSGYAPSNLKLNFHSNQNRHSHKLVVPRPRLGGNLWNNLPLSIQILSHHKTLFLFFLKQYSMNKNHNKP